MQSLTQDLLEGAAAIAEFIGKTQRSTYHLIYNDQIPHFRKGRRIFARRSELEAAFRSDGGNAATALDSNV